MEPILSRASRVEWSFVQDRAVVKDPQSDLFLTLNDVAALIWESLDGATTLDQLIEIITTTYEVDPATARRDVVSFIASLSELDLLEHASSGTPPPFDIPRHSVAPLES